MTVGAVVDHCDPTPASRTKPIEAVTPSSAKVNGAGRSGVRR